VEEKLINIYKATQHKRQPIPTIYDWFLSLTLA
jgi:NAD+ synthase